MALPKLQSSVLAQTQERRAGRSRGPVMVMVIEAYAA
jgi:hypothetical protein